MVSCFQEISLKFTMYNNFFLGCATRKIVVIILKNAKLPFEYFLQLCRFSRNMVLQKYCFYKNLETLAGRISISVHKIELSLLEPEPTPKTTLEEKIERI